MKAKDGGMQLAGGRYIHRSEAPTTQTEDAPTQDAQYLLRPSINHRSSHRTERRSRKGPKWMGLARGEREGGGEADRMDSKLVGLKKPWLERVRSAVWRRVCRFLPFFLPPKMNKCGTGLLSNGLERRRDM